MEFIYILTTVLIILVGVYLFVKEYFTIDTTSIIIMALFIVTGVLSPEEGFSGFINPATVTIACMYVISASIFKSGLIDSLSNKIINLAKKNYIVAYILILFSTAFFSAFINDTAIVALMIPIAMELSRKTNTSPSKLLIPISFAACFGGACTLIGTGANLLVSGYAQQSGYQAFGMFEFAKPALILAGIGFAYMFIVAPFLLPKRESSNQEIQIQSNKYITEILVLENTNELSKPLFETKLVKDLNAEIINIKRNDKLYESINHDWVLEVDDEIKILIDVDNLSKLKYDKEYNIKGDVEIQLSQETSKEITEKESDSQEKTLVEVLVPYGSTIAGKSLKELNFRNSYQCSVIAIRHRQETLSNNIGNVVIKEGDMLLVFGFKKYINNIISSKNVFPLNTIEKKKLNYKKAIPSLIITAGVVSAAALNITSIVISGMVGCLLLVLFSLLKPKDAYEAIDWKVIFMMAGVLSMGTALQKTGTSNIISNFLYTNFADLDMRLTLSLVFLVTLLLTNILSGRATAALMAPIVISLSDAFAISERPLLVAVMFACAFTFMTPVSNPTNTIVYSPGNYKFTDYVKVGTPLNIIIWLAATFVIPIFFPF